MKLLLGNCLDVLKTIEENSVHSVVTDPPYGLAFMNKKWDYDVPSVEIWKEVLRVLRPGGHLLSFGGTRTYHRMVVNIEDAGLEIRDQIQWIYGSGFPKSLNIGKAIDKAAGAEREIVGFNPNHRGESQMRNPHTKSLGQNGNITAPATELAKQWEGWGTALKPANEPIVLARKPLDGTAAENIEKWGVGGLNIDGCRIGTDNVQCNKKGGGGTTFHGQTEKPRLSGSTCGRWPANVMFDEEAAEMLDEQSGILKSGGKQNASYTNENDGIFTPGGNQQSNFYGSSGGVSRFFYCAKASKRERNAGLEGMPEQITNDGRQTEIDNAYQRGITKRQNHHPTVKPIKLMEYLCKLVTPANGVILDPFMGSGSTGVAAKNLGFGFVGIEREKEYWEIANKRVLNIDVT